MKIKLARILLVSTMTLIMLPAYARGGGGGFRGGGGGFGRGGGDFNRGGNFDRGGHDFNRGDARSFDDGSHSGFDRGSADNGVRNYGGSGFDSISSVRSNAGMFAGRQMPSNLSNVANNRNLLTQQSTHRLTQTDLADQGNQIRNSFNHYNFNHWGGYNGWNNHAGFWGYPGAWYPGGWTAATAWSCAGFASLATFCGLAEMSQPVNYDYGSSIVYQGDTVYVNGQPTNSAADYYQQAQQLAQTQNPSTSAVQDNWKPLGVFSLVQGKQSDSTMVMQLAINSEGTIKGNYYNQITGESSQISGSLNKTTQRLAWTIGKNTSTVFDTSLGNLMKNESPVLVHYGANNTQEMSLVRVNEPAQTTTS